MPLDPNANGAQTLLIDADDTLWENNIYFERAIAGFISFLNHHEYSPARVRGVLNEVERECIITHGYGLHSFARFVGIDLGCEPVPDETTVCKFRHLLEAHQLGEQILGQVNLHLQAQGVRITTGTIVDATILHAPTSTKNREQQRDPEMHQTKKGKQWYFGMKAHVGVDSKTKIIHTA